MYQVQDDSKKIDNKSNNNSSSKNVREKGKYWNEKLQQTPFSDFSDGERREAGFTALVGVGFHLGRGHSLIIHGMNKIQTDLRSDQN